MSGNIYFTSDLHFNHYNILKYCNRPFKDVNHMNRVLIDNWNSRITPEDRVYVLGDFAMGNKSHWSRFLQALNGYKILVKGNHDRGHEFMKSIGFDEVYDNMMYGDPKDPWQLVHDPMGMTGKVLCGHVHVAWKYHKSDVLEAINVGVDQWNFTPQTFEELMTAREVK